MYYLGIDGGGTKTRGVLSNEQGTVLADRVTGPSNPNDQTLTCATETLAALVRDLLSDALLTDAMQTGRESLSVFAGIAGVLNHKQALTEALTAALADLVGLSRLRIGSDVELLLAELPAENGACVIIGTGSACFVRRGNTPLLSRIGGWGYLLDSGGSGYDIGRDGLEAALRAHDGRGPVTTLSDRLKIHLGRPVPAALSAIYEGGKPFIAACAPCVFAAAEEDGDPVACAILDRNARAIAELCRTAAHLLCTDAPDEVPTVIFGGGIAQNAPTYLDRIADAMTGEMPICFQKTDRAPVMGALDLARIP